MNMPGLEKSGWFVFLLAVGFLLPQSSLRAELSPAEARIFSAGRGASGRSFYSGMRLSA